MEDISSLATHDFCNVIDEMKTSMSAVRQVVRSIKESSASLDTRDGISLLSLKHHVLLSYLQSLVLVSSQRALGSSLATRSPPAQPFGVVDRDSRGSDPGDLVDSMVEGRLVLEKIKVLEGRMRYQIEKLVRVAEEPDKHPGIVNDPLAFRPNPKNLMGSGENDMSDGEASKETRDIYTDRNNNATADGIYHPPRLAPMPYIEKSKSQSRKERPPIPSALASLLHTSDASRPHVESTSGLGSTPSLVSGRAAHLKRLTEFEEENFSRVMMKKSDARRRAQDEEDLALGGVLSGGVGGRNRRRAGGLEDEFGDVLKSVGRTSTSGAGGGRGDGYDELRNKGKKATVLERSRGEGRTRNREDAFGVDEIESGKMKKRTRFEMDTKAAKKRLKSRK
ncbi:hypothetical protein BD779DRAFT_1669006 [Infundibulicybe gibba]|nr:hypothetical protein BD779DRAFT_1669006 [Infundibulicybe gibba]